MMGHRAKIFFFKIILIFSSLINFAYAEIDSQLTNQDEKNDSVFIQAKVDTNSPYVQSQLLYTFKLFYRAQLENPHIELPRIEDGMLAQVGEDKHYRTTINGKEFFVVEKNFAIFPKKPGKFVISAIRFRALQFDIHANTIDDFFPNATNKIVDLSTSAFVLNVKKIPADFQGKIWLPAKNITLTEEWSIDPKKWETGNPVTRTVTITTHGLRADQIPDLTFETIDGVNVYADPPQRSNRFQDNLVIGTWQQKTTYIANVSQAFTLPAIELHWWNTQTNVNTLAQLPAIAVQAQSVSTTEANKPKENASLSLPLTPSIERHQVQANSTVPFYSLPWFWVALGLFSMWLLTLYVLWKNKARPKTPVARKHLDAPKQMGQDSLTQACEDHDPVSAQQQLLAWAKTHWPDSAHSLESLRERIANEDFKKALEDLEKTLYSRQNKEWNGHTLLAAFRQVRKSVAQTTRRQRKEEMKLNDPLPPLHL